MDSKKEEFSSPPSPRLQLPPRTKRKKERVELARKKRKESFFPPLLSFRADDEMNNETLVRQEEW